MNILVIVKQTFDTEEPIVIKDNRINEEDITFILNPYDEYAVEAAIQIKEGMGAQVTVVTLGPARSEQALRTALAMGADQAVLIDDEALFVDEYVTAKALAAFARQNHYDLIFGGQMSVDNGSAQTGPRLAEELGIPFVTAILEFKLEGNKAIVKRDLEGNRETLKVELPALFTAQQGLNEPRYPSLANVMKAKKKPLLKLSAADLYLSPADSTSKVQPVDYFVMPKKPAGKILQGSIEDQVRELITLLESSVKIG